MDIIFRISYRVLNVLGLAKVGDHQKPRIFENFQAICKKDSFFLLGEVDRGGRD